MNQYGLGFISDHNIYEHVKTTILKYRCKISLKEFKKNLIDPIKLTFDSNIYKKDINVILEREIIRQCDKSNTNLIGYFHQNIFKYLHNDWKVPDKGYDIVNEKNSMYIEMKNKHNTMNSSSVQKIYMKMKDTIAHNPVAKCFLVEVIAKKSQNIVWQITLDGTRVFDKRIRKMSVDKFYELVTKNPLSFKNLCLVLPTIIKDVVKDIKLPKKSNTVIDELKAIDANLLQSLYMITFKNYEGFYDFFI